MKILLKEISMLNLLTRILKELKTEPVDEKITEGIVKVEPIDNNSIRMK